MSNSSEIIGILDESTEMIGTLDGDLVRGYSAYEIYLENGGSLSEADWLESLNGKNGHTPKITSEKVGTREHKLYADGVEFASVFDGFDGADAISPMAAVSKEGNITTITIRDKEGTTTATVIDGIDGRDGTKDMQYHFCIPGEYNPSTGIPTVQDPDSSILYAVPAGSTFNLFCYRDNSWSLFQNASLVNRAILG